MIVTLTCKKRLLSPLDASSLKPEVFLGLGQQDCLAIPISSSHDRRVADLFEVHVENSQIPEHPIVLRLRGDCSRLNGLGTAMASGVLWVEGDVGNLFGSKLKNGICLATGQAGNQCGLAMRGGLLVVNQDCGHRLAGPLVGKASGMKGGDIIVGGRVGDRVCEKMRRGTVVIGETAGDYGCHQIKAGTVVVLREIGQAWCLGMKRGTLIAPLPKPKPSTAAAFSQSRDFELSFLPILWNHVKSQIQRVQSLAERLGSKPVLSSMQIPSTRWVSRRIGDLAYGGQGEWLSLPDSS